MYSLWSNLYSKIPDLLQKPQSLQAPGAFSDAANRAPFSQWGANGVGVNYVLVMIRRLLVFKIELHEWQSCP